MKRFAFFCTLALLLAACAQEDYDISKGIDREVTLFTDEVSLPLGDIGPLTPGLLLGGTSATDMLKDYIQVDEDGYLVVEKTKEVFSNFSLLLSFGILDPANPTVSVDDFSGNLDSNSSILEGFGLGLKQQTFSLYARNPLTEDISVSGKLTLLSAPGDANPAETIVTDSFANANVEALSKSTEVFRVERPDGKAFFSCLLENLRLHLPVAFTEKDPDGGMGIFSLSYRYKSFIGLDSDFPVAIPVDINDLNLPIGQYKVKDIELCTEVSNEIPVSLELESVDVFVEKTLEDGTSTTEILEDVSITQGIIIAAGSSGHPTTSPLKIDITAKEGTIPDIAALRLNLRILAPVGIADTRLSMNQTVYFNKLRATVSGGITIPGL